MYTKNYLLNFISTTILNNGTKITLKFTKGSDDYEEDDDDVLVLDQVHVEMHGKYVRCQIDILLVKA